MMLDQALHTKGLTAEFYHLLQLHKGTVTIIFANRQIEVQNSFDLGQIQTMIAKEFHLARAIE